MFFHNFLLTISIILVGVQGQVFGQSTFECVDGNSTLPICTERDKKNVACGKIDPNDQAALVACVCNQEWMTLTIQYGHYLL
jgi:hypothetical protein